MIDIIHRVGIKAPISKVYAALSTIEGVAGWWTKETTGVSKTSLKQVKVSPRPMTSKSTIGIRH
jgi:uncharacterized protein YndB with AHSA1/START domain